MTATEFDCAYVKLDLPPEASTYEKNVQKLLWKRFIVFRNTQSILATALQSVESDAERHQQHWAIREMERTGDARVALELFLRVLREGAGDSELLKHTRQACQRWFERVWKAGGRYELSDKDLRDLTQQGIQVERDCIRGMLCMRLLNSKGAPLRCNRERHMLQWGGGEMVAECWLAPERSGANTEACTPFEVEIFLGTTDVKLRLEVNSDWGVAPPWRKEVTLELDASQAFQPTKPERFQIPADQEPGRVWVTLAVGTQSLDSLTVHVKRAAAAKKTAKKPPAKKKERKSNPPARSKKPAR